MMTEEQNKKVALARDLLACKPSLASYIKISAALRGLNSMVRANLLTEFKKVYFSQVNQIVVKRETRNVRDQQVQGRYTVRTETFYLQDKDVAMIKVQEKNAEKSIVVKQLGRVWMDEVPLFVYEILAELPFGVELPSLVK